MTTRRYAICDVVSTGPGPDEYGFLPTASGPAAEPLVIAELTEAEAAAERQRPGRLAVEQMPLALIAPLEATMQLPARGVEWGVEAVGATKTSYTGRGVTVAILDTGVDDSHPAFAGVQVVHRNFTDESEADTHGHGTHCAGTAVGRDVSGRRIGVATGVTQLLDVKVLGSGCTTVELAQAIRWASQEGANVISMSLGVDFPGFVKRRIDEGVPVQAATSQALAAYRDNIALFGTLSASLKAESVYAGGCLIVAATGNESARDKTPTYTVDVSPPAAADGILRVGAVQQRSAGYEIAPFSNTGANVVAPGMNVVSAAPGGGLVAMNGTSMATPHVAGIAALWAEKLLESGGPLDPTTLRLKVEGSTQELPDAAAFDVGAGLVQAPSSV